MSESAREGRDAEARATAIAERLSRILHGEVSSRTVLLGAGASVEAGIPDGSALHATLLEDDQLPLYQSISERLRFRGGYPDVERVFRILEAMSEERSGRDSLVSDLRVLGFYSAGASSSSDAQAELHVIAQHLRRKLWRPSTLLSRVTAEAQRKTFEVSPELRYLVPVIDAHVGGTLATLNYDNSVEEAGGTRVKVGESTRRVLVPLETTSTIRLLKLHGSLDWERVGDDVIRRARPLEVEDYEPAIIFGAGNKLRHYGPFLDLLRAFVDCLTRSRVVITIGYGFRDPHITEALRVWATHPEPDMKRLFVCLGPSVKRLPDNVLTWRTYEHLQVELIAMPASELISRFF